MGRIRSLKPSFWLDEDLAELPHWIRLLYQGLWTMADREGRLEDRAKRIKAEIFPYGNEDIEEGLQQLCRNKRGDKEPFIIRYQISGEQFIQIVKWNKHQNPHPTERRSILPSPNKQSPIEEKQTAKELSDVEQWKKRVHDNGFNISRLINKFKKILKERKVLYQLPDDVQVEICKTYLASPSKFNSRSPWPYFMKLLKIKMEEHYVSNNIKQVEKEKAAPIIPLIAELISGIGDIDE